MTLSEDKIDQWILDVHQHLIDIIDNAQHPKQPAHKMSLLQTNAIFFIGKSFRTQGAILHLASKGLAEDMAVLVRSLFETLITFRFLRTRATPDEIDRYVELTVFNRQKLLNGMKKLFPDITKNTDLEKEIQEEADRVGAKMAAKGIRSKKFIDLRERARRLNIEDIYESVYIHLSSFAHPDPLSVPYYVQLKSNGWNVMLDHPNYETSNVMLLMSAGFLAQILVEYNEIFDCGVDGSDLDAIAQKLQVKLMKVDCPLTFK